MALLPVLAAEKVSRIGVPGRAIDRLTLEVVTVHA
jgi:hypothetical protein